MKSMMPFDSHVAASFRLPRASAGTRWLSFRLGPRGYRWCSRPTSGGPGRLWCPGHRRSARNRVSNTSEVFSKTFPKDRKQFCMDLLTEWVTLSWSPDRQTHREGVPDDVTDGASTQCSFS